MHRGSSKHRFSVIAISAAALAIAALVAPSAGAARRKPITRPAATSSTSPPRAVTNFDVDAASLPEVSGCAVSRRDPTIVWAHNDSGNEAAVIPVNRNTGAVGAAVAITNAKPKDPEDLAIDADGTLWLGDIGDNDRKRDEIAVYAFSEPAAGARTAEATSIRLRYPDGPHDAEALLIAPDSKDLIVITKDKSGVASVFRAPSAPSTATVTMTQVGSIAIRGETYPKPNLITAADALPDGTGVIVRTYERGYLLRRKPGQQFASVWQAGPEPIELPFMIQGEAICVAPDARTLITASESFGANTFRMSVLPTPR